MLARRLVGYICIALTVAGPTAAEPLRDDATGLTIDPPDGYAATRMTPSHAFAARFEVKKDTDRDTGCQIAFTPLPQNGGLSQDKLNTAMESRQWRDLARATLALNYNLGDTGTFAHAGVQGILVVGDVKARPGIPSRAQEIKTLFVILETPKGRTTTVCVGEKASFDERRAEFEAVARGVVPPR